MDCHGFGTIYLTRVLPAARNRKMPDTQQLPPPPTKGSVVTEKLKAVTFRTWMGLACALGLWVCDRLEVPFKFTLLVGVVSITCFAVGLWKWASMFHHEGTEHQKWESIKLRIVIVFLFVTSVISAALVFTYSQFDNRVAAEWSNKQVAVSRKSYMNEKVEIDGKIFHECTFRNARLVFHGGGPASFVECQFPGSTMLATDNKAAKTYLALLANLAARPAVTNFSYGTLDKDGNVEFIQLPKK